MRGAAAPRRPPWGRPYTAGTMLAQPAPSSRPPRRRLRVVKVLPTLVTAGNLFCGVLALSYLVDAAKAPPAQQEAFVVLAAWMVFAGMACDALDGRIARMMRVSSPFGAQLDSLADVVTFGATPAVMAKALMVTSGTDLPARIAMGLVALYAVGAALRLARYNTESAAVAAGAGAHVTRTFRGLPSPAAAGTVAALVLLKHEYGLPWMDWAVLLSCPVLGVLMISRLPYTHVMNRYVDRGAGLGTVVLAVVAIWLVISFFEATVAGLFLLYVLSGPAVALAALASDRFGWALREDEDEGAPPEDEEEAPVVEPPGRQG